MEFIKKSLGGFRQRIHDLTADAKMREWNKLKTRILKFKDIHKGESCFIIGNGPSLNLVNLDELIGIPTLASNKIYLIYDRTDWRPTYHFAIDPYVIEQSHSQFLKSKSEFFLSYLDTKRRINYIDKRFNYFWVGNEIFFNGFDLGEKIGGGMVTYTAMQVAYFMGFKEVYIIGIDHNYFQKSNSGEVEKMEGNDLNHFHPDYFKGQTWWTPSLNRVELCYQLAKYYFEKDGRSIYNATVGGKLEVFERVDFHDAVKRVKSVLSNIQKISHA